MSCLYNLKKKQSMQKCVLLRPQKSALKDRIVRHCREGLVRRPVEGSVVGLSAFSRLEQKLRAEQHSERRGVNQHDVQLGSGAGEEVVERLLAFERREHKVEAHCQQFLTALYSTAIP